MSQKRDSSASPSDEEMKKKVKLDASSSSGSACAIGTAANEDSLKPLMESSDKANTDSSSLNIHGQHSQTENMGSPSSSLRKSPSSSREEQSPGLVDGGPSERQLVYTKKLTFSDIYYGRMMIPGECAAVLFPGLKRRIILPVMDSKRQLWDIEALFDELSYCYMLRANWNTFANEHGLRPEDKIFFYQDPKLDYYLIDIKREEWAIARRVAAEDK
ncbi:hypothetical protein AAG906_038838 [Vitis piasezkii]